jgi:hypothetical protein
MLEKRKPPRKKMVLPVKLSMGEDNHLAHTLDISHSPIRILSATGIWKHS